MEWVQPTNVIITRVPTSILDSLLARQPPALVAGSPHGLTAWRGRAEHALVAATVSVLTEWPPSHAPLGRQGEETGPQFSGPHPKSQSSQWEVGSQEEGLMGIAPVLKSCPAPSCLSLGLRVLRFQPGHLLS